MHSVWLLGSMFDKYIFPYFLAMLFLPDSLVLEPWIFGFYRISVSWHRSNKSFLRKSRKWILTQTERFWVDVLLNALRTEGLKQLRVSLRYFRNAENLLLHGFEQIDATESLSLGPIWVTCWGMPYDIHVSWQGACSRVYEKKKKGDFSFVVLYITGDKVWKVAGVRPGNLSAWPSPIRFHWLDTVGLYPPLFYHRPCYITGWVMPSYRHT